ncbi:hypothetical protein COLSTE_01341 [Collinsella stercoris DSM 13279]|uniref:Uncharacterized protein n=1 Tax=Collinsella stercoris DSM 13279 TaxID=445975 RepID=B6GB83_9ACTN|nr:hypothetical protein COLSTE_01341 [Collinsella stercoris DSM 13279]
MSARMNEVVCARKHERGTRARKYERVCLHPQTSTGAPALASRNEAACTLGHE